MQGAINPAPEHRFPLCFRLLRRFWVECSLLSMDFRESITRKNQKIMEINKKVDRIKIWGYQILKHTAHFSFIKKNRNAIS